MHFRIFQRLSIFIAPILSGFLLTLAFPRYDLGWLGWIALVPLLISILFRKALSAFFFSLIFGVILFSGVFSWIFDVPGYTFLHHILLGLYFGPLMGLFGLTLNTICRRWSTSSALLAAPFIWVGIEYIRSNLSFLALPWALLGHSQYQYPLIIQFAAFTGVYGISFLMVFTNAALTATILTFFGAAEEIDAVRISPPCKGAAISMLLTATAWVILALVYGHQIVSQPFKGPAIKTSVLQGNIDIEIKANPRKHAQFIMQKYADLTRQASKDQPELIIWPEAATPGFVLKNMPLHRELTSLIKETKTNFLIGSSEYPKFAKRSDINPEEIGNTALFFSPDGKVVDQYLKIRLVPFGEYLPYKEIIPWPNFIVQKEWKIYEIPGNKFTLFRIKEARFGVLICWEIVFPEVFRKFVKSGANFMINITNEGWFGETAAPYQLAAVNVFRAVENRVYVARAANTGISCFIDPFGRIYGRVKNNNKDIFIEGYLTEEIRISHAKTFYTIYGDVFVVVNLIIIVFMVILCFFKGRR